MANAIALWNGLAPADDGGTGHTLVFDVVYTGVDVVPTGRAWASLRVTVASSATPAAIRTAMSSAVVADALTRGLTVAASNIVLPTMQKG